MTHPLHNLRKATESHRNMIGAVAEHAARLAAEAEDERQARIQAARDGDSSQAADDHRPA